jgi:hypothetical protein
MTQLVLPNTKTLRPYQREVMAYFDGGGSRAACVWHRRAGKDFVAAHQIAKMAHKRRGLYYHCLPSQRQARKVVWETLTRSGDRLIDQAFPLALRKGEANVTEMRIPLKCGSAYQLVGSDNYGGLIGSNPVGIVFSEWSLTDPRVWDYVRPILVENGGWAWFIYTPRGYNHGYDIKCVAESNPDWFFSTQTVEDTGILSQKDIDQERKDGMPEELIQQEFYCSFSSANVGAILGSYIEAATNEGRIVDGDLYDPNGRDVLVSMDIGFRDTAAAWFWQIRPDGPCLIDYKEDNGLDAQDWIKVLHESRYPPKTVYLPHDARAKTFASKHSVMEQFLASGMDVRIVPNAKIMDRINAARSILPHCKFAKTLCERGLMSLRDWSFAWDDVRKVFGRDPLHNWASHGSDGFTYGALVISNLVKDWSAQPKDQETVIITPQGAHYTFTLDQLWDMHENKGQVLRL